MSFGSKKITVCVVALAEQLAFAPRVDRGDSNGRSAVKNFIAFFRYRPNQQNFTIENADQSNFMAGTPDNSCGYLIFSQFL